MQYIYYFSLHLKDNEEIIFEFRNVSKRKKVFLESVTFSTLALDKSHHHIL